MGKVFKFGCLGIVALVVIGIIIAFASGGDDKGGGNKASEAKTYKVNEAIGTGKVEATVTNIENKDKVGTEYVNKQASEGGTFVAVQYKLKNTSDKPVGTFSFPTIQLVDEKGTEYDFDVDASANYATEKGEDNTKILSDLNPGITVNGSAVFEISKDAYQKGKWFVLIDGKYKVPVK